jgi:ribose transport system ATP-binding protein
VFLGRERLTRIGTLDRRRMHAEARRLLDSLSADADTRTPVHRLGVAAQQAVEIAKALSQRARILVMDEPTAALSEREIAALFETIRRLQRDGVAIVYISHRLHEIFTIGDRITVLRDGRKVATADPSQTTLDELVHLMIGRQVDTTYRQRFCERPGAPVLEVRDLRAASGVHDASLEVRAGEIVGLAGLVGAGRTELARAIFGADRVVGGSVRVNGMAVAAGPTAASRAGMGLVPEDRKQQGLALMRSVQDNLLVAGLRRLFPRGWYRPAVAAGVAGELVGRLGVKTPSTRRLTRLLSGGNQQKVVIGKWLNAGSRFFIFDEPTRGIDVGAKAEIFRLMEDLVARGAAVLMISSDLNEIIAVCDRAYVVRDKTIVGELCRADLSEENILRLAMHHA